MKMDAWASSQPTSVYAKAAAPNQHPPISWARTVLSWCHNDCSCPDITPHQPQPVPDARPACVAEQDAEPANDVQSANHNQGAAIPTNQCPATTADHSRQKDFDRPVSSEWYGEPVVSDCLSALRSLREHLLAHLVDAEEGIPDHDWPHDTWDDFQDRLPFEVNFAVSDKLAYLMQKYPEIKFIEEPLTIAKGASSLVSKGGASRANSIHATQSDAVLWPCSADVVHHGNLLTFVTFSTSIEVV